MFRVRVSAVTIHRAILPHCSVLVQFFEDRRTFTDYSSKFGEVTVIPFAMGVVKGDNRAFPP